MLSLINNLHEKKHHRNQERGNFDRARVTTMLSCYNFALVVHEKCTPFQLMGRA